MLLLIIWSITNRECCFIYSFRAAFAFIAESFAIVVSRNKPSPANGRSNDTAIGYWPRKYVRGMRYRIVERNEAPKEIVEWRRTGWPCYPVIKVGILTAKKRSYSRHDSPTVSILFSSLDLFIVQDSFSHFIYFYKHEKFLHFILNFYISVFLYFTNIVEAQQKKKNASEREKWWKK